MARAGRAEEAAVADLARRMVGSVAPEELPFFDSTSAEYFRASGDVRRLQKGSGEEELGFGGELVVALMTPVALRVAQDVVLVLRADISRAAGTGIKNSIRRLAARLLRRDLVETSEPIKLSGDQLAEVRRLACRQALQFVSQREADLLADSLVGCLAAPPR